MQRLRATLPWWQRAIRDPLIAAFAFSLLGHAAMWGVYLVRPQFLWQSHGVLIKWLASVTRVDAPERARPLLVNKVLPKALQMPEVLPPVASAEMPLQFVQVDPAASVQEAPKESKYYSTHNTVAANPKPDDKREAKIDGSETRFARLTENLRPNPSPAPPQVAPKTPPPEKKPPVKPPEEPRPRETLQPGPPQTGKVESKTEPARPVEQLAPQPLEKAPEQPDQRPPGGQKPGDLAMATPAKQDLPVKEPGAGQRTSATPLVTDPGPPPQRTRPRTLAEAVRSNPALAGKLMKQEGGVRQQRMVASIDAKASPFGAYDSVFISLVQQRWYQLLDNNQYMLDRRGKVVVDFRLTFDGRITELKEAENSVGDMLGLLCRRAVEDPAPFPRWPGDMRRMIGTDYRDVRFTFYYD